MGVVICDSPGGRFAVVTIAKCGSTKIRQLLDPFAVPGQYHFENGRCIKHAPWVLGGRYAGECGARSWGVLRNPWKRIVSRWREKRLLFGMLTPWPEWLDGFKMSGSSVGAKSQAYFLGAVHPARLVAIENLAGWLPELAECFGVDFGPDAHVSRSIRDHGSYDWRTPYREHPETVQIVREIWSPDWNLGLEWETP